MMGLFNSVSICRCNGGISFFMFPSLSPLLSRFMLPLWSFMIYMVLVVSIMSLYLWMILKQLLGGDFQTIITSQKTSQLWGPFLFGFHFSSEFLLWNVCIWDGIIWFVPWVSWISLCKAGKAWSNLHLILLLIFHGFHSTKFSSPFQTPHCPM